MELALEKIGPKITFAATFAQLLNQMEVESEWFQFYFLIEIWLFARLKLFVFTSIVLIS